MCPARPANPKPRAILLLLSRFLSGLSRLAFPVWRYGALSSGLLETASQRSQAWNGMSFPKRRLSAARTSCQPKRASGRSASHDCSCTLSARASEDVLFASETGNPHYSGSVGQQLRARWDRLPIDRFRTHDLRRTVATMMVAQLKLPLELVAIVVGHTVGGSQTQTLVRNYVHDQFVDRKAGALAQWDRRLRQILAGEAGKVVAFEYNRTHTKNVRGEDHTHKM